MTTPIPVTGQIIDLTDASELAGRFGKTVTAQNLALAELMISMRTGTDISTVEIIDAMESTDRYWLAQAIVFQALWIPSQSDLLERLAVSEISTDGDSMVLDHDALMLSPMAKWALLRTSLMEWGTVDVQPDRRTLGVGYSGAVTDIGFRPWSG